MQGVHAEVRNYFRKSVHNYIVTARVLQGKGDLEGSSAEEQRDIVMRWATRKHELRGFYLLKQKEKKGETTPGAVGEVDDVLDKEPKTGWLHTRHLSLEERRKLHEQREAWKRRMAVRQGQAGEGSDAPPEYAPDENDELEEAIMASVRQTSHGDRYEDARIERAIRASVIEMRRIAERSGREEKGGIIFGNDTNAREGPPAAVVAAAARAGLAPGVGPSASGLPGEDSLDITDEEYQQLIAEAVRLSMSEQQASAALGHASPEEDEEFRRALEESKTSFGSGGGGRGGVTNPDDDSEEDEMLRRALEESTRSIGPPPTLPPRSPGAEGPDGDDDELLRQAMEESERAHREQLERTQTEEEMVLEYVKQQSLAEEEVRRQQAKGKGKAPAVGDGDGDADDDDDDLRRALEESLRATGKVGEASASGSASRKGKNNADADADADAPGGSGAGKASGWGAGWKAEVEAQAQGPAEETATDTSAKTPPTTQASGRAVPDEDTKPADGGKGNDSHEHAR